MPADDRTTRAQRELGAELARLRTDAGMSIRQLGRWHVPAGSPQPIPHARIPRIESGDAVPTPAQLTHWLDATQAGDAARQRINGLVENLHAESSRWRSLLAASPDKELQRLAAERERTATAVDDCCHQWTPGLLQTREYAHALFRMLDDAGYDIAVETATELRMRRQERLHEPGRRFRFLLTRRALTWNPDPTVVSMTTQLDRIRELGSLPTVDVRVLDDGARPVAPWTSFTLYDGDEPFVSIELEHRALLALDEEDVARYRLRFGQLWEAGVPL